MTRTTTTTLLVILTSLASGCGGGGGKSSSTAPVASPTIEFPAPTVTAGALLSPRVGHAATLFGEGLVLITGGETLTETATDTAELIDVRSGRRLALSARMTTARVGHVATSLGDGRVLIAGGRDASGAPLTSVELWDEQTRTFTPAPTALATPHVNGGASVAAFEELVVWGGEGDATCEVFLLPSLTPIKVLPLAHEGPGIATSGLFGAGFQTAAGHDFSYVPGDDAVTLNPPFDYFLDTRVTGAAQTDIARAGGFLGERPTDRLELASFPEYTFTLAAPRSEVTLTDLFYATGEGEGLALITGGRGVDGRAAGAFEIVHQSPLEANGAFVQATLDRAELDARLAALRQVRAERDGFRAEAKRLRTQIADVTSRTAAQRTTNADLSAALSRSETKRRAAEASVARLEATKAALEAEIRRLEAQAQRDRDAIAAAQRGLQSAQADLAVAQVELATARSDEADRRARLDRANGELAALRAQESDLRRRLTAAPPPAASTPARTPPPTSTSNLRSRPGLPSQTSGPTISMRVGKFDVAVKPADLVIPINWTASADTQSVLVQAKSDGGTFPQWTTLRFGTIFNKTSFSFGWKPGGLPKNEVFQLRVVARDAQGRSTPSNVESIGPF